MIQSNIISEKYASMQDSELVAFAQSESHQLTPEGHELLQAEISRRNLNPDGNGDTQTGGSFSNSRQAENYDLYPATFWVYAFDQKENNKIDIEIIAGLIELGMEETSAMKLVMNIDTAAKQRLKKAESEKLTGGAILMCGIAITFLPLSMPANRLTYIIAWCAIFLGTLIFIKGLYNKSRFKKIIQFVALEK